MSLQQRINELFSERPELKNNHLATAINCSRSTITDWRKGKVTTISGDLAFKVGDFFEVNPKWVQTGLGKKGITPMENNGKIPPPLSSKGVLAVTPTTIQHFTGIKNLELIVAIYNLWTIRECRDPRQRINDTIALLEGYRDTNGNGEQNRQHETAG
jgi:hypothetical protein